MPAAKSQVTKDRYIRASNFQAKLQLLSVLSAKLSGIGCRGRSITVKLVDPSRRFSNFSAPNLLISAGPDVQVAAPR